MSEKTNEKYKYSVVQYKSIQKNQNTNYIVICSEWIVTKNKLKFFYWPKKSWLHNKEAVKKDEKVDCDTWHVAPILTIVKHSNDFYDSVLCAVTLRRFNINAFIIDNLNEVHARMYEYLNCPNCSKVLHEIAASYTCADVPENEVVTKFLPQSPRPVVKLSQDLHSELSPNILNREKVDTKLTSSKSTDDPMSPSLLDSYRRNAPKKFYPSSSNSIKKSPQDKLSEDLATSRDNAMSPSLLDNYYSKSRNVTKKINNSVRLENKFNEM